MSLIWADLVVHQQSAAVPVVQLCWAPICSEDEFAVAMASSSALSDSSTA